MLFSLEATKETLSTLLNDMNPLVKEICKEYN